MGFFSSITKEVLDDALGIEPEKLQKEVFDDVLGIDPPKSGPAVPLGQLFLPTKEDTGPQVAVAVEPAGSEGVQTLDSWAWTQKFLEARRQQAASEKQSRQSLVSAEQSKAMAEARAEIEDVSKKQLFQIAAFLAILILVIL